MKFDGTDTYPVGVLHTLQRIGRVLTVRSDLLRGRRLKLAKGFAISELRYLRTQIKAREWRAVRNSFNGYLAEHQHGGHNAGRGWTKRAAERRVARICKAS